MRILVVEDEYGLRLALRKHLEKQKFTVDLAEDGNIAIDKIMINDYDMILLDLNLPGKGGLEICKEIRAKGNDVAIIMLTARDEVEDKINGLNIGADDYLGKPFEIKELIARISALFRRKESRSSDQITTEDGLLQINIVAKSAVLNGTKLALKNKEYRILEYLMRNIGKVVSQEELYEHIWGESQNPFSQTIKVQINNLRKVIDVGRQTSYIETFINQGYMIK